MGSTLTVDNIKDSGDNTLVSSTGSGHTLASGIAVPAAGITGTLGSGVTFPAGHIVQVKSYRHSPTQGTYTYGTTAFQSAYYTGWIIGGDASTTTEGVSFSNNVGVNNHVLIMYNATFIQTSGGSNGHTDIFITGGGLGTRDSTLAPSTGFKVNDGGRNSVDGMFWPEPNDTRESVSMTTLDTGPFANSSSQPVYNLWYSCQLSLNFKTSSFDMTLMEIQT